MAYYTQAQVNELATQSTSAILAHFGTPVTIQVVRSEKTNTPCIVFHADSGLLCTVLAIKHANDLAKMQPDWQPMTLKASKDKEGVFFSVIPLKGLRPSTLRAWIAKGRTAGFVIDDQVLQPTVRAEVTTDLPASLEADLCSEPVEVSVMDKPVEVVVVSTTPDEARVIYQIDGVSYPALNPIQARIQSLTTKEMKDYLRSIGEKVSGNKQQLRERVMASI